MGTGGYIILPGTPLTKQQQEVCHSAHLYFCTHKEVMRAMDTKTVQRIKFMAYAIKSLISIATYIVFVAMDNNPLAGVLFIAPIFEEFLEDMVLNRDELKNDGKLIVINWIVFAILMISLVLFTLTAIGVLGKIATVVAAAMLAITPAKYVFYMVFYYKE